MVFPRQGGEYLHLNATLVSVILPVWNGERFLRESLDSILAQEGVHLEVVASDDGSTDASPRILAEYAARDPRIRMINRDGDRGLVGNFNRCLRAARGTWIKPVFQDDLLIERDALRRMLQVGEQDPATVMVGCGSLVIDAAGRQLERRLHLGTVSAVDGRDVILKCLERAENLIGEPSLVLFRASAAAGGLEASYRQLVDLEHHFRVLEQGRFASVDAPLAAFRRHEAQLSALHQRSDVSVRESRMLFNAWWAKGWVQDRASRQLLFTQIRRLRRYHAADSRDEQAELILRLGRGWYALLWMRRRLFRAVGVQA
jgi:glycosyltransferase involved in cell wall biosynthesis